MADENTVGGVNVEITANLAEYDAALRQAEVATQASAARMAGAFSAPNAATVQLARAQLALIDSYARTGAASAEMARAVGGAAAVQQLLANTSKASAEAQAVLTAATKGSTASIAQETVATVADTAAKQADTAATTAQTAAHINSRAAYEGLVIVHEALSGRFSRMASSAMILGGAMAGTEGTAGLLGAATTTLGIAVLATAGAMVAADVASVQYSAAQERLRLTTLGVGAASGETAAELESAAQAAAASSSETISDARAAAEAFAGANIRNRESLAELTSSVQAYAKLMDEDVPTATKKLAEAFADPVHGASELNQALGFLSPTEETQIETMARLGDRQGAVNKLTQDFTGYLHGVQSASGGTATGIDGIASAVSRVWDWLGKANQQWDIFAGFAFLFGGPQGLAAQEAARGGPGAHPDLSTKPGAANLGRAFGASAFAISPLRNRLGGQAAAIANPMVLGDQQRREQIQGDISTLQRGLATETRGSAQWNADAEALRRENAALQNFHSQADLNHQLALLAESDAQRGTTATQRAENARKRYMLEHGGDTSMSQADIARGAADAATQAADRRQGGARHGHADPVAQETDTIAANTTALLAEAEAYLKDRDADVLMQAARKQAADYVISHPHANAEAMTQEFLGQSVAGEAAQSARRASDMEDQAQALNRLNEATMGGAHATADYAERLKETAELTRLQALADVASGQANTDLLQIIQATTKAYDDMAAAKARELALADQERQLDEILSHAFDDTKFITEHKDAVNAEIATLQARAAAYGMSSEQAATFLEYQKLLAEAEAKNITLTDADKASLADLAQAYGHAETAAQRLAQAQQGAAEASQSLADGLEKVIESSIFDKKNPMEALKAFGRDEAKAFLQAEMTGKGPLAGVLGTGQTSGPGSTNGGILSRLVGGLFGLPGGGRPDGTPANPLHVISDSGAPDALGGIGGLGQSSGGATNPFSSILQTLGLGGNGSAGGPFAGLLQLLGLGGGGAGAASVGNTIGSLIEAVPFHSGTHYATAGPGRFVDPALFARAPRLHSGLAPGEFPAILQQGEGVTPRGAPASTRPGLVQISLAGANGDQTIKRYTREGVMAGMKATQEASPAQQLRYQLLEG